MDEQLERLVDDLTRAGLAPRPGVALREHTTFRIGGPADCFVVATTERNLLEALRLAAVSNVPFFLLGGGSNLLVRDGGLAGLVIKDGTSGWTLTDDRVTVASGTWFDDLVQALADDGVGGLEFLAGIPGTVGGAVCGNAGAYGRDIADCLESVRLFRDGRVVDVQPTELAYGYRTSLLKRRTSDAVVLGATLRVNRTPPEPPRRRVDEILAHRAGRLPPPDLGCAGSYFKNLPPLEPGGRRRAAGQLLDEAGAKGRRRGDAQVYQGHANVIVNLGSARAADVLALAAELQDLVRTRFAVELEPEVMTVGREP